MKGIISYVPTSSQTLCLDIIKTGTLRSFNAKWVQNWYNHTKKLLKLCLFTPNLHYLILNILFCISDLSNSQSSCFSGGLWPSASNASARTKGFLSSCLLLINIMLFIFLRIRQCNQKGQIKFTKKILVAKLLFKKHYISVFLSVCPCVRQV